MRRLLVGAVSLSAAMAALAPTASAQFAGEAQGVTVARGAHGYVVRFAPRAAKLYRRIAGRRVEVGCSTVTRLAGGFSVDGGSTGVARAPRRGGRIRTGDLSRADFCTVKLRRHHQLVVMAPITANGRVYLDELRTSAELMAVFEVRDADDPPWSTAEAVARGRGFIVALDGPDGTPPRGKVGYWTDGTRVVSAAVTATGRRLFFELERDVVRTNILLYLNAAA